MIDRDNRAGGWCSLEDAVSGDHAYAVQVSDRLLAVDADNPGATYVQLLDALTALYVPHIELASGGADHRRHLWIVLGAISQNLSQRLHAAVRSLGLDVRAGRSLIRPPLAPHRSRSAMATLLAPLSAVQAVQVLSGDGCGPDRAVQLLDALTSTSTPLLAPARPHGPRRPHGELSERTRFLLDQRDQRYSTRSEQLRAVLVSLVNADWTQQVAVDLVLSSWIGEKARERRDPAGWLAAEWVRAVSWVAAHPAVKDRTDTRLELARCRSTAAGWQWERGNGSAPATLARVLGALLDLAANVGLLQVSVSVRQLAESSGVGRSAAERALGVLRSQKVLCLVDGHSGTNAATYRIDTHHQVFLGGGDRQRDTKPHTPLAVSSVPLTVTPPRDPSKWRSDHDGWRHGALGGSALIVAQHLHADEPLTAGQIAAQLGLSRSWVLVLLRRLRSVGLIVHTANGWLAGSPHTRKQCLEAAAQRYGTAGAAQRQRVQHQRERAHWSLWQAAVLARRHAIEIVDGDQVQSIDRETGELLHTRPLLDPLPVPLLTAA